MAMIGHLLSSCTPGVLWRIFQEAAMDLQPRYTLRLLKMLALGLPLGIAGTIERFRYHEAVESTKLSAPPVFILGHWRTGTTHLHNLMSQDPQFGCLTNYAAMAPNNCLVGRSLFRHIVYSMVPEKRLQDDMRFDLDLPQEEEFAMTGLFGLSYYKTFSF